MKNIIVALIALPLLYVFLPGCKKDDAGYHKDAGVPSIVIKANDVSLAFPGAEGFGQKISGGRGGKLIRVTNLNDAGEGSLRAAVEATGSRIIMFNVSGTIVLNSPLKVTHDSVTIAGHTAPGDGITLRKYPMTINANNVVVRFMRFRLGDEAGNAEAEAISAYQKKNIIIDHCSISWSTDEAASFYNNENFTLQWSIISESLHNTANPQGTRGYGGVWGGKNASFHHNLLASNDSRNPRFGEIAGSSFAATDLVDFRNNVIYNWSNNSVSGGEAMHINLVNNYYKPGPATSASKAERIFAIDKSLSPTTPEYNKWGKYYISGNVVEGYPNPTADNWKYGVANQFNAAYGLVHDTAITNMKLTTALSISSNVTTHDSTIVLARVLAFAGASLKRDVVDERVIDNVKNGTGSGTANGIINTQGEVGGWPNLQSSAAPTDTDGDGMPDEWEISKGLDPKFKNGSSKNLSNVYDNVEVYINSLVNDITVNQVK